MNSYPVQLSFSRVIDANQSLSITYVDAEIEYTNETDPDNFATERFNADTDELYNPRNVRVTSNISG
jgi:hypothetical protein